MPAFTLDLEKNYIFKNRAMLIIKKKQMMLKNVFLLRSSLSDYCHYFLKWYRWKRAGKTLRALKCNKRTPMLLI